MRLVIKCPKCKQSRKGFRFLGPLDTIECVGCGVSVRNPLFKRLWESGMSQGRCSAKETILKALGLR